MLSKPLKGYGGSSDARRIARGSSKTGESGPDPKEPAERVQTLWFSFLIFMVYLAIAAGTTTHRMLFLESPLNLLVLNIALPLRGFYILAPIIFVVFHFYMLLSLLLLARTAKSFEDALVDTFPHGYDAREKFRMRIENTLFVQLLVGGKLERAGITANLLELIAIFTLIAAPIQTIFMIQTMFLPYHSWPITWLHRVLLYLDLWFLIALWEGYRSTWGVWSLPKWYWFFDESWIARAGAGVLVLACLVATFHDEPMYIAGMVWLEPRHNSFGPPQANTFNTLDLHGEDLIDDEKLARIVKKNENPEQGPDSQRWIATLSLAGRNLTGANLSGADIRHADFSHSILNRAFIDNVWAENADFTAVMFKDASLNFARMTGARLDFAVLKRAELQFAQLQGASLVHAYLQGADLHKAYLQGANLEEAQAHGGTLSYAQLQGARFDYAQLQAANLERADLSGARLSITHLQGALLEGTNLQGAELTSTELQGALLDHAQLQGASFDNVLVWRADARQANWMDTRVTGPETGRKYICYKDKRRDACDWTPGAYEDLNKLISNFEVGKERIKQRLDPDKSLDGEDEMAKEWAGREHSSPAPEAFESRLAIVWKQTGCAADGAPHVARELSRRLRTASDLAREVPAGSWSPFYSSFGRDSPQGAHTRRRLPRQ